MSAAILRLPSSTTEAVSRGGLLPLGRKGQSESPTEGRCERALDGAGVRVIIPLERGRLKGGSSIGWNYNWNVVSETERRRL